ncbi:MAG: hypothetical protein KGZ39_02425 [Simkania sp.]|nr:hypothetical protein [Simkania sp.]
MASVQKTLSEHYSTGSLQAFTTPVESAESQASRPMHYLKFLQHIEQLYLELDRFPIRVQRVYVYTIIQGGLGDFAAAAKIINEIFRKHPKLQFVWGYNNTYLLEKNQLQFTPPPPFFSYFLHEQSRSNVTIIDLDKESPPPDLLSTHLLICGPVQCSINTAHLCAKLAINLQGPRWDFCENSIEKTSHLENIKNSCLDNPTWSLHTRYSYLFPSHSSIKNTVRSMGLTPGTGILIDESRKQASLHIDRLSSLQNLQNPILKNKIYTTLHCEDTDSYPDSDQYSIYFGYAHYIESWQNFIICAAREKQRSLLLLLNQHGIQATTEKTEEIYCKYPVRFFNDIILGNELKRFLHTHGYQTIRVIDITTDTIAETTLGSGRELTILLYEYLDPDDIKCLQLAADGYLCTGDHSAGEAISAAGGKTPLYIYEPWAHKNRFYKEQLRIARECSLQLEAFLTICTDHTSDLTERMTKILPFLEDPLLAEATHRFCTCIRTNYSFNSIALGSIARALWHFQHKYLIEAEISSLTKESKQKLLKFPLLPDQDPTFDINSDSLRGDIQAITSAT